MKVIITDGQSVKAFDAALVAKVAARAIMHMRDGLEAGEPVPQDELYCAQFLAAKRGQVQDTSGQTEGQTTGPTDTGHVMSDLMDLNGAARYLVCSPRTVRRRAVEAEAIPYLREGRRLLFRRSDLDAYLKALEAA